MREEICGNLTKPHMETYIAVRRTWLSHLSLLVMHVMRLRSKLFSRVIFNYSNTSKMSPTATHPTLPREHSSGPQLHLSYLLLMQHFYYEASQRNVNLLYMMPWNFGIHWQLRCETTQREKWITIPGQLTNDFRGTARPKKWNGDKRQKDLVFCIFRFNERVRTNRFLYACVRSSMHKSYISFVLPTYFKLHQIQYHWT